MSSFIRIDEIHQQLEEQLSVLAHFIDGVANLRPKGLFRYLFTIYMGRPVHGLGKWKAKFRTGKFRFGIAIIICTNQFHLPRNGREGVKLV